MPQALIPIAASVGGSLVSGALNGGGGGASPLANYAAGQLTYSPPVSQTNPGAFNPPSGSGIAYNYIPTGGPQVDTGAQAQIGANSGISDAWRQLLMGTPGTAATTTPGAITMAGYGAANPDVLQSWQQLSSGTADPAAMAWFQSLPAEARASPDAFAQWHYQNFGTQEGRGTGTTPTTTPGTAGTPGLLTDILNAYRNNLMPAATAAGTASTQQGNANLDLAAALRGLSGQLTPWVADTMNAGRDMSNMLLPGAQQILAMGMDPRSEYLQRAQHQFDEAQNAQLARMGLGQSGAGAGIAQEGQRNFTLDWQNQQLARALSALQGGGQALGTAANIRNAGTYAGTNIAGTAANVGTAGANIGATAPGQIYNGGAMPFNAATAGTGAIASALQSYLAGSDPATARALQYLQAITGASKVANDAAGAQVGVNASQNGQAAAALAPLLQGGINAGANVLNGIFSGGWNGSGSPVNWSTVGPGWTGTASIQNPPPIQTGGGVDFSWFQPNF